MSMLPLLTEISKDLQRRKVISHVFCLGSVVTVKLTEQTLLLKTYHEGHVLYSQSDSMAA